MSGQMENKNKKEKEGLDMGKKVLLLFLAFFWAACFSGAVMAQHDHGHGEAVSSPEKGKPAEMSMKSGPVQSATVEGWKVTLEVMSMGEHMKHMQMAKGGSHGEAEHSKSHMFMVRVQDTASKEIISDAKVAYTVLNPSGGKETGKLEWSGDHYGAGFSPKEKGTYQVQLMIESGGMEREAKFTYKAN
jgi:hypothetical protein